VSEIQQNRYDSLLRRVADLKGPGSKVNDALTELFPMIDVENVPGELLFLSGTKLGMMGTQQAAEVASIPKTQIFNPLGSGKLVTVTSVVMSANLSASFEMVLTTTAIGISVGNNVVRDTRGGVPSVSTTEIRTQLDAAGIATFFVVRARSDTAVTITDRNGVCILAPGTGLTVAPEITDVIFTASFFFRERVAERSELNF